MAILKIYNDNIKKRVQPTQGKYRKYSMPPNNSNQSNSSYVSGIDDDEDNQRGDQSHSSKKHMTASQLGRMPIRRGSRSNPRKSKPI